MNEITKINFTTSIVIILGTYIIIITCGAFAKQSFLGEINKVKNQSLTQNENPILKANPDEIESLKKQLYELDYKVNDLDKEIPNFIRYITIIVSVATIFTLFINYKNYKYNSQIKARLKDEFDYTLTNNKNTLSEYVIKFDNLLSVNNKKYSLFFEEYETRYKYLVKEMLTMSELIILNNTKEDKVRMGILKARLRALSYEIHTARGAIQHLLTLGNKNDIPFLINLQRLWELRFKIYDEKVDKEKIKRILKEITRAIEDLADNNLTENMMNYNEAQKYSPNSKTNPGY